MLDPRRLLTFREVAAQRSFSRAAEALSLSQPAVSQQIAALERELGTALLERRPGGLELTAAGRLALDHAESVAAHLARADSQLAELVRSERRQLRVGTFPSALATVVPAAIARLVEAEPELEADVREGRTDQLAAAVRDGELRVAYLTTDPLANAALVGAGLCVSLMPRLLTGELARVAVADVQDGPCREVFALLPAAGATPLARAFVDALAAADQRDRG